MSNYLSTAFAAYFDRTVNIETYDELFSGLECTKHETRVRDITLIISTCNGAIETLVKIIHQMLVSSIPHFISVSTPYLVTKEGPCPSSTRYENLRQENT